MLLVDLNDSWSYDRYGNRWNQTAAPSGSQAQFAFNPANNQVVGFQYDAAGNLLSDGMHNYSYDVEGNMTLVDGGAAARYAYDAANHQVRTEAGDRAVEWVFNLAGQKVSAWDADTGAVLEQSTYWGAQSLSVFTNNTLYFEHADWLGSKRLLSAPDGTQAGAYGSLPFGDDLAVSGTDVDPLHFAGLDHDYESGLDHAQYREYSSAQAHWMSPDPYSGSYDGSNPQSLNRYSYVGNNPLSFTDPSGQDGGGVCATAGAATAASGIGAGVGIGICAAGLIFDGYELLKGLFGGGSSFHGSLKPRPNAQPWDEYNIRYGPNIAGALGLPDDTCEFGGCGGGGMGFQQGAATSNAQTWANIKASVEIGWFALSSIRNSNPIALHVGLHQVTIGDWCGPGGSGNGLSSTDDACHIHDVCYDTNQLSILDNFRNNLPSGKASALQACNQALCNAAGGVIKAYFSGVGSLYGGQCR